MKIAFFDIKPYEREFFEKSLKDKNVELFFFEKTVKEVLEKPMNFDVISVFYTSKIDKDVLNKLPNLKYIQTRSTGVDHLDLVEIYKRGIIASNVVGYAGPCVGEFAYGLLLEAIRKLYVAIVRLKWGCREYEDLKGIEIEGKTIGILGLGTIGTQMAKIAKGFNAKTIGLNRSYKKEFDDLVDEFTQNLDYVLENSDFLFIALPLTPSTKNLINKENIKKFKGKVIVNPARAEIIEEDVYRKFDGIIAADVLPNWDLAKKENIIATPHMAYYTEEALKRIMQISLENLLDFLDGKTPRNCLRVYLEKEHK
ncbi:lactate dehydrogenase [Caminibacter mediatlanticus TB-2]|uniref:Lactate dehydrogenase n=1 Tax=Caminibacter mediatlanticus TB-2 TaxID=391592 RepID=A0ABX5V841_9BACT|nr:NAD(P)-dependent oxidoreductase [Caminibacter mediatlanticus]QCT94403.1 lactate dehydrogenase [Caminibacter mediatlanticus TB-2]